jgi:hypothetical protein
VIDLERAGGEFLKLGRILDRNVNDIVRLVALACDQQIVLLTPVDTGLARANWQVNIGPPIRTVIEPYRRYPKGSFRNRGAQGGLGERINANGAFRQASAALAGYNGQRLITISNNVEYIDDLDSGRGSRQAPEGMTGPGVTAGIRAAARAARKILARGL